MEWLSTEFNDYNGLSISYEILSKPISESEEMEWIKKVEPSPEHPFIGMKFKIKGEEGNVIYNIKDITEKYMVIGWYNGVKRIENFEWLLKSYFDYVTEDEIEIIYDKPITESEDLEWIKNIEPTKMEPRRGDKVLVINKGREKDYLQWLGMFSNDYKNGNYGDTILGEVINTEVINADGNNDSFLLKEEMTGDEIFFPYYSNMASEGLDLYYEIVNIPY